MYKTAQEIELPDVSGLISNFSNTELKELLEDDDKSAPRYDEIVKDLKEFRGLETEKEMVIASNRSLAEFNLSKQPTLEEGRQLLMELSQKGQELCESVKSKLDEIQEKSGKMSVETALDLLQAAAAEIEQESEEVAEKFLAGDMEVDEFFDQFLTRRKLMHSRKVKVDKMRELIRKQSSTSGPGYPTTGTHFPPYPMDPVHMPVPMPVFTPY